MSCQRKEILGIKTIINVINHPLLRNLPFVLEGPNEIADGLVMRQRSNFQ